MKAVLYVAHGTRSKKGELEARSFLQKIMMKAPLPIQEISFLELSEPSMDEGFARCIQQGATDITVIPIFLLAAGHMKRDIPDNVKRWKQKYPQIRIELLNALGVQEEIVDGIVELIHESIIDLKRNDSILIVGRGSSDPDIYQAFAQIENMLRKRIKIESISTCYLAAAEPSFTCGLNRQLTNTTGRVIVVPYLLFSGLLLSEVSRTCRKFGSKVIQMGPLSHYPAIESLLVRKVSIPNICSLR
ncbi:sirohydrochlorin chelatase [Robertmurraya andreesenii]|uniref:Sirohydrochlorin ferrochelatase n=1 Tax=Anoxybacillus andreesenii TaxID=1325932 RepID=A0ABT9V0M8_9BACL|nr:sirohydrochlorin chelatase [Robertmurraya andreesenii]MDQ0154457.1 sirohydrochlorin ferrochelatase [Robertmurraya andreesenii]